MTPKQSLETSRATVTSEPTPEPKKRTKSDGVAAGQLFTKLATIDSEEAAELAASPADIRARYEAKRTKALGEVSEEVRQLVNRMRGSDADGR